MVTADKQLDIYIEKQIRTPHFYMPYEHTHEYCEIFYLKHGSCTYFVNGCSYHVDTGDLFIVAAGDVHHTEYEGIVPCERIIAYCKPTAFDTSFLEEYPEIAENLSQSCKVVFPKKEHLLLENFFNRMLEENDIPDVYSYRFLTLQMMELLLTIQRNGILVYEQIKEPGNFSNDIEEVLRYIAQNYAMPLTLEEVADSVNLSPTYLSKKIKRVTGSTFKEHVNYIRIKQACKMLLITDDSITKIAMNCGFNSSNYFKDCFRSICGVSPRAFRQQALRFEDYSSGKASSVKDSSMAAPSVDSPLSIDSASSLNKPSKPVHGRRVKSQIVVTD